MQGINTIKYAGLSGLMATLGIGGLSLLWQNAAEPVTPRIKGGTMVITPAPQSTDLTSKIELREQQNPDTTPTEFVDTPAAENTAEEHITIPQNDFSELLKIGQSLNDPTTTKNKKYHLLSDALNILQRTAPHTLYKDTPAMMMDELNTLVSQTLGQAGIQNYTDFHAAVYAATYNYRTSLTEKIKSADDGGFATLTNEGACKVYTQLESLKKTYDVLITLAHSDPTTSRKEQTAYVQELENESSANFTYTTKLTQQTPPGYSCP
jgi:hypothetical protein